MRFNITRKKSDFSPSGLLTKANLNPDTQLAVTPSVSKSLKLKNKNRWFYNLRKRFGKPKTEAEPLFQEEDHATNLLVKPTTGDKNTREILERIERFNEREIGVARVNLMNPNVSSADAYMHVQTNIEEITKVEVDRLDIDDQEKEKVKKRVLFNVTRRKYDFDEDNEDNIEAANQLPKNRMVSTACGTESNEMATDMDDFLQHQNYILNLENDSESFLLNSTKTLKDVLRDNIKKCKASARLTYYLKCKHAFSIRTPALLATMRQDARIWMNTYDHKMETAEEYNMLTSSVLAAYMVDPMEYKFYALCKQRSFWNTITSINEALQGIAKIRQNTYLGALLDKHERVRGIPKSLLYPSKVRVSYLPTHDKSQI